MNTSEINETFQLRGHTRIWKNDELVFDKDNAIVPGGASDTTSPTGLKAYLAESMSSAIDRAINSFFNTSDTGTPPTNSNYDISENGAVDAAFHTKDGIIICAIDAPVTDAFAMATTSATKTQSFGRKWKGTFTATGARQFSKAALGHSLKTDTTGLSGLEDLFVTAYAQQTFTTVTLATGDTLTIEWEVYIA
jgi:hypothetical protein